jgi:hypothetical protein
MARAGIVVVLIVSLLLSACAHQQPVAQCAPESQDEQADVVSRFSRSDHWLENHPLLNGLTTCTGMAIAWTVVVVVAVTLWALESWAKSHSK